MSKFKLGVLIGCGVGLFGVAVLAIWLLRDTIPPLSREAFDAARARWNERGPTNYDFSVVFSGGQPGSYDVEVRGGEVTRLVLDGEPLRRTDSWKSWTVPGMFDLMAMDLALIEDAARGVAERGSELRVSAEFDEQLGYPRRYRRIVLGIQQPTSEWEFTGFTSRPDEAK